MLIANRVNRINHSEQVMTKEKARKKKNKNKDAFNELKDFAFETKENGKNKLRKKNRHFLSQCFANLW